MRIQIPSLPVFIFLVILPLAHLANGRYIGNQGTTGKTEQSLRSSLLSFPSSRRLGAIPLSVGFGNTKFGPIQSVSHLLVPGGPNPLHN
ncbi:CLE14p like [Actinidia chinensis var. chinensis]|uniref:CLE14p like n=1 Tax=Actinidia chinensis var. chinensis TaxID=1590841 RepID=A0A2R6RWB3_ACTCC|nr:CLE14p like [Actinidia chinensis var. chinensis]